MLVRTKISFAEKRQIFLGKPVIHMVGFWILDTIATTWKDLYLQGLRLLFHLLLIANLPLSSYYFVLNNAHLVI